MNSGTSTFGETLMIPSLKYRLISSSNDNLTALTLVFWRAASCWHMAKSYHDSFDAENSAKLAIDNNTGRSAEICFDFITTAGGCCTVAATAVVSIFSRRSFRFFRFPLVPRAIKGNMIDEPPVECFHTGRPARQNGKKGQITIPILGLRSRTPNLEPKEKRKEE